MVGKKLGLFLMFLLFAQLAQGQLSNFTLSVAKTDETCTNNGTLTFNVSNTTAGSTILYSIFLLPDTTTPISVQSAGSISGLSAGTYRVIATQSLGNQSGTQQQDITINDVTDPLSYQLSSTNEICGNDGTITVTTTHGTAVSYEIISGPMTRALQASNIFTGLTAGVYQVRVFDACHDGVVQTYALLGSDPRLSLTLFEPSLDSCTSVNIGFNVQTLVANGVIQYPLQVNTTVYPPSGPPITSSTIFGNGLTFTETVPFYENQSYTYTFDIVDACNVHYTLSGTIHDLVFSPATHILAPQDCSHQQIAFSYISALVLTAAPTSFGVSVPYNYTPSITHNYLNIYGLTSGTYVYQVTDMCGVVETVTVEVIVDENAVQPFFIIGDATCTQASVNIYEITGLVMVSSPASFGVAMPHDYTSLINAANYAVFESLPIGTYLFHVIDRCGTPRDMTIIVEPVSVVPSTVVLEGCGVGSGSVQLTGQFVSISLVAAPEAYTTALPVNLIGNVTTNGTKLSLDNLPPGVYTFESSNSCNQSFTTNVTITGYQDTTDITVTPNCGSFNLEVHHTSNNSVASYWLQKYNPVTGNWGHPLTSAVYPDGSVPDASNSFLLSINSTVINLGFSGHFRILKAFSSYTNDNPATVTCTRVISEFDFSDAPQIDNVYSLSCGATYEIIVNAHGNTTLTYRIITKDGQPFLVQNGTSSIFSGLTPGIYVFQVEDLCHNTVNSQFEVLNPNPMQITATPIPCDGGNASLSVPNFAFLAYQWWKGSDTATILSTTNFLNFPSFNAAADAGTYHVRILYAGNPNSCLNQVLDYTIPTGINTTPHAGNDNAVSYCGRQGIIDLGTLLTGTFDTTGTWAEITLSGSLSNHSWDSSNVTFGTYQFRYTVTGSCNLADDSVISITIKPIPQLPIASVDPVVCESENLNLFATSIANATYHWSGPNGFTSTLQNPTIPSISEAQNGVYSVYADQDGCQSAVSDVTVLVNPLPSFALSQDCVGKDYQVSATRLDETSYDEANCTFIWVGPNNFTSSQNPITITGAATGTYTLTIVNAHGCQATDSIEVVRTNCFIPNVITPNNDQTNDDFDLTGFEVSKLEIYNRWGRKVYEKKDYTDQWHGQNMNGGILPDATYYYIIKLGTDAEEETKTGWIFLSRG